MGASLLALAKSIYYNDVKSLKTFDTRGILSTPASSVHDRLKTNGTAIKIAR